MKRDLVERLKVRVNHILSIRDIKIRNRLKESRVVWMEDHAEEGQERERVSE